MYVQTILLKETICHFEIIYLRIVIFINAFHLLLNKIEEEI
jgi:hypothetical protein